MKEAAAAEVADELVMVRSTGWPRLQLGLGRIGFVHATLCAVLLLALALRVYGLTSESLWNDELSTVMKISAPPWNSGIWRAICNDVHPPGHVILTWAFASLFGNSEFSLRFPSALAGTASVLFIYSLGRNLYSKAAGLAGALFAAVSPFLIEYSQQARPYALIFFTSCWTLLAWLDLLRDDGTRRERGWRVVTAALAAAAGAYLHYSGLLFSATVGTLALFFAVATARKQLWCVLGAIGLSLLLYAPWTLGLLDDLRRGGLSFEEAPDEQRLKRFPTVAVPAYVYLAAVALAATNARGSNTQAGARSSALPIPRTLFLMLVFLVLVLGFYIKSIVGESIYNGRNLIVAWPPVFVLLGAAATAGIAGFRSLVTRGVAISALAVVVVLDLVYVDEYYSEQTSEHFRQATRAGLTWLEGAPRPRIVAYTWGKHFDYYLEHFDYQGSVTARPRSNSEIVHAVEHEFDAGATHVLLLTGHRNPGKALRDLKRRLRVTHAEIFPGATATVFTQKTRKKRRR